MHSNQLFCAASSDLQLKPESCTPSTLHRSLGFVQALLRSAPLGCPRVSAGGTLLAVCSNILAKPQCLLLPLPSISLHPPLPSILVFHNQVCRTVRSTVCNIRHFSNAFLCCAFRKCTSCSTCGEEPEHVWYYMLLATWQYHLSYLALDYPCRNKNKKAVKTKNRTVLSAAKTTMPQLLWRHRWFVFSSAICGKTVSKGQRILDSLSVSKCVSFWGMSMSCFALPMWWQRNYCKLRQEQELPEWENKKLHAMRGVKPRVWS